MGVFGWLELVLYCNSTLFFLFLSFPPFFFPRINQKLNVVVAVVGLRVSNGATDTWPPQRSTASPPPDYSNGYHARSDLSVRSNPFPINVLMGHSDNVSYSGASMITTLSALNLILGVNCLAEPKRRCCCVAWPGHSRHTSLKGVKGTVYLMFTPHRNHHASLPHHL